MRDYTFKYCRQRKHSEPRTGPDNDSRSRREDFDDEVGSTKNVLGREFPSGPELRTWCFHFRGMGLIPGQGTKILQALQCWGKKEKERKERKEGGKSKHTHTHTKQKGCWVASKVDFIRIPQRFFLRNISHCFAKILGD